MHADLNNMLEASIELELQVAKLYLLFYHKIPQDSDFWWNLMLEEQNHAALLRSIKDVFVPRGSIPENMVAESLDSITRSCVALQRWHQYFSASPPSRDQAFNLALGMENSAAELHFQRFMDKTPDSKEEEVFQQLNAGDKDHAQRLLDYMDAHNIGIRPEICDPAEI
ncbi:MAG: hypothetical protein LC645_06570 [Geobacteraceae bacterium]|nr:hypothetical protein [Geobacteraceae bacterium]